MLYSYYYFTALRISLNQINFKFHLNHIEFLIKTIHLIFIKNQFLNSLLVQFVQIKIQTFIKIKQSMYTLNLVFKQNTKKLTLPKTLKTSDLYTLIEQSFKLRQKVLGLTNSRGQLISFQQIKKNSINYEKQKLYLVATQDMNDDNMSFASDHGAQYKKDLSKKEKIYEAQTIKDVEIPQKLEGFYQGVIGDLELFEEMFLEDNEVTIVFCFVKQKPKNFLYPYYLYHTSRNSAIVYFGYERVCEFFIQSMSEIPKSIQTFVQSLAPQKPPSQQQILQKAFGKKSKTISEKISSKQSQERFSINNNHKAKQLEKQIIFDSDDKLMDLHQNDEDLVSDQENPLENNQQEDDQNLEKQNNVESEEEEEVNPTEGEVQSSLVENLLKLRDDGEITELQFYKMKSQLLQNFSDFMRKYQMGTRKGLRKDRNKFIAEQQKFDKRPKNSNRLKRQIPQQKRYQQKQQKQDKQYRLQQKSQDRNTRTPQSKNVPRSAYSRDQRRSKKYQIPIIVRKYNNVIEKISTSYPLTQEQQQSINLILQLELKGLISQKQSGIYKTCILQQDQDVFPLFLDYFDNLIDQLQLVSRLKRIKKINSEKKQRSQHNMRLLIKHARQNSYELLRTLLLEKNHLVLAALEKFRSDKNAQRLAIRLEKIAIVYRQKEQLEGDVFD